MDTKNIIKAIMVFKHTNKSLKINRQISSKQFKENEKYANAIITLLSKEEGLLFLNKINARNITFKHNHLGIELTNSYISLFPDSLGIMTEKGSDFIFNCKSDNQDLTILQAISEQALSKAKHYGEDIYLFTKVYSNILNGRVKNKFDVK